MLTWRSVRSLYPLALIEGEGVGTAYEYAAKRQVVRRWWKQVGLNQPPEGPLLIAGLPEIYGSSLDYFLLGQEFDRPVLVVDEDPALLAKAEQAVQAAREAGVLTGRPPDFQQVARLDTLAELDEPAGWAICNEVLQRFDPAGQVRYTKKLAEIAGMVTLFAPNGLNDAHVTSSGLAALPPAEMTRLLDQMGGQFPATGFCDLPPFPPGISRSAEQRAQAETGRMEALAMTGLDWFVRLEGLFPAGWQRGQAHIVYAFALTSSTP